MSPDSWVLWLTDSWTHGLTDSRTHEWTHRLMGVKASVALGSNLGDRQDYLNRALHSLREHPAIAVGLVSSFLETAPVGGPSGQGPYLNAAVELETSLGAEDLLRFLLEVEQRLGRVRQERYGPRTIDLDLLLYGNQ